MTETDRKNQETSKAEVAAFNAKPPEKYFLYVKRVDPSRPFFNGAAVQVTTWMGDVLGTGTVGPEYKCPAFGGFGSTRRSIRFAGVNGMMYVGTYFQSSGDYARVRITAQSKRRLAAREQ